MISFLYHKLRRFEANRLQVVNDLLSPDGRFIDIGCGDGSLVFLAKDKFDELYGIDISLKEIEKAKERLKNVLGEDKIKFLQSNIEEGLPFSDDFLIQ